MVDNAVQPLVFHPQSLKFRLVRRDCDISHIELSESLGVRILPRLSKLQGIGVEDIGRVMVVDLIFKAYCPLVDPLLKASHGAAVEKVLHVDVGNVFHVAPEDE